MPDLKQDYARRKLKCLVRDLKEYTPQEFWNQMSRIAQGATGLDGAEELHKQVLELKEHTRLQGKIVAGLRADLAAERGAGYVANA